MTPIVEVNGISKSYGSIRAVDDLSFSANKGELLAMMGPDGARKTSMFRAACGLINFDAGKITIAGFDVATQFEKIKPHLDGKFGVTIAEYTLDLSAAAERR